MTESRRYYCHLRVDMSNDSADISELNEMIENVLEEWSKRMLTMEFLLTLVGIGLNIQICKGR